MGALTALLGAGIGAGILIVIIAFAPPSAKDKVGSPVSSKVQDPVTRRSAIAAVVVGLLGLLLAGNLVGLIVGMVAGALGYSALAGSSSTKDALARLEALATWMEMLRDAVMSHRGLFAAIESTAESAPAEIRSYVQECVALVRTGARMDDAFINLAVKLDSAAADETLAPLVLASRFGGTDLGGLLSLAASNTREQLTIWQKAEVERAKPRRDMRLVLIVTALLVGAMILFGGSFLKPFTSSLVGDMAGIAVAVLFGIGFFFMNRLSRPKPMPRLFPSLEEAQKAAAPLEVPSL